MSLVQPESQRGGEVQDQDQDQYIAGAYSGYRRNGKKRERSAYNLQFFIFLLFLLVLFVKTYLDWVFCI